MSRCCSWPMSARSAGSDADAVEKFLKGGGVLIRFAGPRMSNGADDLVPVRSAHRRALSGQRHGLEPAAASGGLSGASPFNGLAMPGRSDGVAPDPGRAQRRIGRSRLGAAGRRHAAGHGAAKQGRLDRAVPHHRQPRLVVAAAVGTLCRHAQAAAGAVGRHARRVSWRGCPAWRRSACWMASAAAAAADAGHRAHRARAISPTTEVSPKHPPGLYGAKGVASALNELDAHDTLLPLAVPAAMRKAMARRTRWRLQPYLLAAGARCCCCLDALVSLWLRGYLPAAHAGRRRRRCCLLLLAVPHARADDDA